MQRKLIIIVPAYNEGERIEETVAALRAIKDELCHVGFQHLIYVVDDGSNDETGRLAERAGADRVLRHKLNKGLGAAVRTGLSAAQRDQADVAVKFDADLQHNPTDIVNLIKPIADDEADIVYGNRFERISYTMPFMRRVGNSVFTALMRRLTDWPIHDSQPGIFAVDRAYLDVFRLPGDYNYTQQILLDAYHKGMRFAHVSVTFRKRSTGASFISWKYPLKVLPQILMVIVGVRPLRIFTPIGLAFLLLAAVVFGVELIQWLAGDASKPIRSVNLVLGSSLFGLQTLFFGVLAQLIVEMKN